MANYYPRPDDLRTNVKCPQCGGLACFRLYEDLDTRQTLSDYVGKCTRPTCKHEYTPQQHFKDMTSPIVTPEVLKKARQEKYKEHFAEKFKPKRRGEKNDRDRKTMFHDDDDGFNSQWE